MFKYTETTTLAKPNEDFIDEFIRRLPYMDPDSPRFMDMIFAIRARDGKDTFTELFSFDKFNPGKYTLDDVLDVLMSQEEYLEKLEDGKAHVYYHSEGSARIFITEGGKLEHMTTVGWSTNSFAVVTTGRKDWANENLRRLRESFIADEELVIHDLAGFGQEGPAINVNTILHSEVTVGEDAFYPFIEGGIDKLVKDYMESKASVLFLIGPPGTGKSSLLRSMLFKMNRKYNFTITNQNALDHPQLIPWMKTQDRDAIFAIEDADEFTEKRENGNPQMSALLNMADGIVQTNAKIIISTNLASIKDVDGALLRPGRAFKVIKFDFLTHEEANEARKAIGLDEIDFEKDNMSELTLSESLNYENFRDLEEVTYKFGSAGFY